jgi:hypothetical protein
MIIVRVELHSAITGKVSELAQIGIWNKGDEPNPNTGNYRCASYRGRDRASLDLHKVQRQGEILNHKRLQKHVLNLVVKALLTMGYEK